MVDSDERIITYAYDVVGNRLRRNDSVSGETVYVYDENDQIASVDGVPYGYDANGNLVTVGAGDDVVAYGYDIGEVEETRRYVADDNREFSQALLELDGDGGVHAEYVFGTS